MTDRNQKIEAQIADLRSWADHTKTLCWCSGHHKDSVKTIQALLDENKCLRSALEDVDCWLAAFIEAWDKTGPHKGSQAPVALMEAIRQHSKIKEALRDE